MDSLKEYRAEQIADEAARRLEQPLKPCPFCGGDPTLSKYKHGYTIGHICTFVDPTWFPTREQAIAAWNMRACNECERGGIPATEENMAEHGWVKEHTC